MNIYRKFTSDVGVVLLADILTRFRPIIFLPIITKALGASDYGVYTTLTVTISLLMYFAYLGLDSSIVRFFPSEKDRKKVAGGMSSILVFLFFTLTLLAVILALFADLLAATVFGDPGSASVIRIGALLLPVEALLKIVLTYFRMRQRMAVYSLFGLANTFGVIGLASVFLLQGYGLAHVIYAAIAVNFMLLLLASVMMFREIGFSRPDFRSLRTYIKFGAPLVLASLSSIILSIGDRYVIGLVMGAAAVGMYSVAYNMGNLVLVLLHPINIALLAPLSKAYDEGKNREVLNYLKYSVKYFLMVAVPATVGMLLMSGALIKTLTTGEFEQGSIGVTAVVALSNIAYGVYLIVSNILYLQKKSKTISLMLVLAAGFNIGLNVLIVPVAGVIGAALATLASFTALSAASLYISSKHIRISVDFVFLIKCVIAAAVMGAVVYLISPRGAAMLALATILGAGIYFGTLFLLRAFGRNELEFFKSFLRRQEPTILEET